MIKIENVEIQGFEPAIRGMRNPKNSWDRSDSRYCAAFTIGEINDEVCQNCPAYAFTEEMIEDRSDETPCTLINDGTFTDHWNGFVIGPNDHELAMKLAAGGPVHAKYRRMIVVWADITAPLYWWKEFDTYKVGTVANSCSTMHKIHAKEFTLDDFSHEHLMTDELSVLNTVIEALNANRIDFLETKDKKYWWQMIQLLPSSYNQKRTVMFSYEMLANTDIWRADHKQDEWRDFCKWALTLPYSELFHKKRPEEIEFFNKRINLPEETMSHGE